MDADQQLVHSASSTDRAYATKVVSRTNEMVTDASIAKAPRRPTTKRQRCLKNSTKDVPYGQQVQYLRSVEEAAKLQRRATIMLKFAWRWAAVGDDVWCHDRDNLERELIPGVVASAKTVNGETQIGVKITENGETRWIWPTPLFLHPNPRDPDESCWICDQNGIRPAT